MASLRTLVLRPGELRPLSRAGLVLLAARCALRCEPWLPPGAEALWRRGLGDVVAGAFTPASGPPAWGRALGDLGARVCNQLDATDAPRGRCHNYAAQALVLAGEAAALVERAPLVKQVIVVAKHAGSIPAVLAHAGRVVAPPGRDAVDHACETVWAAIRGDVGWVVGHEASIAGARDPVAALRAALA